MCGKRGVPGLRILKVAPWSKACGPGSVRGDGKLLRLCGVLFRSRANTDDAVVEREVA